MNVLLGATMVAPDFSLTDSDGNIFSFNNSQGKKVILYFYPAAGTPGCTKESCDFRDNLSSFQKAGYKVIGISKDQPEKLRKFKEEQGLTFDLLSDPELLVHKQFGAFGEKSLYGKKVTGVIRSTFVVDEAGKIEHALYNVKATGHVASLKKKLGLLSAD